MTLMLHMPQYFIYLIYIYYIDQINNTPALFQIMAWCQIGNKPLSEPMMVCSTDAYMHHLAPMS